MSSELLHGFYLNELFIEPAHGRVSRGGETLHLPPKASEVLLCLAERPGEVVGRDQILDTVWGPGSGSTEALSHAIGEIRRALGDHHDHPVYIQTLPRRGYRLLVTPEAATVGSDSVVIGSEGGARFEDIGLFENLRQRGVFETALAYLVLGWLLIQVADIVFAQLLLPRWTGTFVTVLVIAGFPIALVLSWFLEIRGGNAVLDQLSPKDRRRKRFGNTYLSVLGGLSIAAVAVFLYDQSVGLPEEGTPAATPDVKALLPVEDNSIAVLPLMPLDDTEESRILSNGLAEDVISRLSRVPGLLVASRGDSFTLAPNSSSSDVRDRLRVAMYVEGSVQFDNELLRVVVQLIDSETGFHVLSRTFDRPLANYFDMRDDITALVVSSLRPALPPETRTAPVPATSDPDFDVYFLYRRGVEASRQPDVEGSTAEALRWFDAALAVDSDYAAAYAGKCAVNVEAYIWTDVVEHIEAAESACARALSLSPNLDVVYTSLGDLYAATGRLDEAETAYLEALDIDPRNADALVGLGDVYRQLQRPEDAEATIRKAVGLHPGDWEPYNALGTFLYRSGRYEEAAAQFRLMVALDSTSVRGYTNLGTSLTLAGDFEQAEAAYREALGLEPSFLTYSNLGTTLYYLGEYGQAIEYLQKAIALTPNDYLAHSNMGDALRANGEDDAALAAYRDALELATKALAVNPSDAFLKMDLAWIHASLGDFRKAGDLVAEARSSVPDDPYVHYIDALILNRQGRDDAAVAALMEAVDLGYSRRLLQFDPNLTNLRGSARFRALLESP